MSIQYFSKTSVSWSSVREPALVMYIVNLCEFHSSNVSRSWVTLSTYSNVRAIKDLCSTDIWTSVTHVSKRIRTYPVFTLFPVTTPEWLDSSFVKALARICKDVPKQLDENHHVLSSGLISFPRLSPWCTCFSNREWKCLLEVAEPNNINTNRWSSSATYYKEEAREHCRDYYVID